MNERIDSLEEDVIAEIWRTHERLDETNQRIDRLNQSVDDFKMLF